MGRNAGNGNEWERELSLSFLPWWCLVSQQKYEHKDVTKNEISERERERSCESVYVKVGREREIVCEGISLSIFVL